MEQVLAGLPPQDVTYHCSGLDGQSGTVDARKKAVGKILWERSYWKADGTAACAGTYRVPSPLA